MQPTVLGYCPWTPALKDSKGKIAVAHFNTFDEEMAQKYAEFAAGLNPHDDYKKVVFPARMVLGDKT